MIRFDQWLRNALRREAHDMLRSGPTTVELLRPVGPEFPSDEKVLEVLDLCLQVGEVLLSSGEAAADTSATMMRLATARGLATVDIDITFTSITMCCHRGKSAAPVTSMRILRYRTTDLTRLVMVTGIVNQVVRGELGRAGGWRRAGRGGQCTPSLPALGGHRGLGRARRRGGAAARWTAGDLVDRARGHGVHRPDGPAARPVGGPSVLPADGGWLRGHHLHTRPLRGRGAAGNRAVSGDRSEHHGAVVRFVGDGRARYRTRSPVTSSPPLAVPPR
jgi:hypothetical protein